MVSSSLFINDITGMAGAKVFAPGLNKE